MTIQGATARTLRWSASSAALTLALLSCAGVAQAQSAPPKAAEVEEVVVTGFRSSLAKAINIKRENDSQVDTILAEDIGKFPDLNLSESVQRIPGVAISRDGGEGRQISVRGLGPQFTRVRINGMEALATAGGSDAAGGTNRGRSFDFNVFASDLFNSITVRKTAEASVEEGSMGATVDLNTAHPFDYHGFTAVFSGQGSYNTLAKQTTPRLAGLISNTWRDGQIGALLSVAYTKRQIEDNGTSTVRWATGNAFSPGFASVLGTTCTSSATPATNPAICQTADNAYHPRFPRFDQYTDDQQRLGATLSLQYRPDDKTLLTFDALYADFKGTREERYLEAPSFSVGGACTAANKPGGTGPGTCGIAGTAVTAMTIDSKNTMIAGTFNNVDLRVEDRFDKLDTAFTQYSLNVDRQLSDDAKVTALIGHSKSDHDNPVQTTLTFDQLDVQNYSYDYSKGRVPLLSYGSANLTSPTSWFLSQVRERPQNAQNLYDTAQVDLEWKINNNFKFKGGLDIKKYNFATTEMRRSNGTSANQEAVIPAALAAIPLASYSQLTNFNINGLGAPAGTVTSWLVPNLGVATDALSLYNQTAFGGAFHLGPEPALGNNNSVAEGDRGAYIQTDFNGHLGAMPFRGNIGVRYVKTDETANGYTFLSGAALPITAKHSYADTLPSLNLVFEPRDDFVLRFGAAKTMARANLGSLVPGATVNVSGANRTVSAGNPNLAPFRAKSYDLAFEWYPMKGTIVSLALFRKDLDSFVQTAQSTQIFHGNTFGIPDSVAIAACNGLTGCDTTTTNWTFTVPVNTPGGPIEGYELNYQQPLTFLPSFLSHTGLLVNYTSVKSSIQYLSSTGAAVASNDLTGLSRKSYNATVYYEDSRFSARVSAAYRSKYLTRVPGQEAGTDVDGTNATFNVDASAQYTFNDHLKFTFEGINLTDEFQDQYNDSSNRVSFYHHTGSEYLFGFRYTH